jgi:hypothetical protein
MKFADIINIWTVDLDMLSNADRGRVFYERAKQVVSAALTNADERKRAISRNRLRRVYLVEKIGCKPSVPTQNPRIRSLLAETDLKLKREASLGASARPSKSLTPHEAAKLIATVDDLRRQIYEQRLEITELRRLLGT